MRLIRSSLTTMTNEATILGVALVLGNVPDNNENPCIREHLTYTSRRMRWYWPEITILKQRRKQLSKGAASFFIAGITALVATASIYLRKPILGLDAWSLVDATIFAIAGWRTRRLSRTWAVVAFVLFLIEKIYELVSNPVPSGFVMAIVLLLALLAAVRGTFAYHRFKRNEAEGPLRQLRPAPGNKASPTERHQPNPDTISCSPRRFPHPTSCSTPPTSTKYHKLYSLVHQWLTSFTATL